MFYKPYTMRLDDLLVRMNVCSYRRVHKLLRTKNLSVNGITIKDSEHSSGLLIDTRADSIFIDGMPLNMQKDIYLMMNKMQGTVCTMQKGWNTRVIDCIKEEEYKLEILGHTLQPIGRLDKDTEGLLILTTDGKLNHLLTVPETHISKTYLVHLQTACTQEEQKAYSAMFMEGLDIPEGRTGRAFKSLPAELEWQSEDICYLTISEGKFHQVKRMFKAIKNEVTFLKRIKIGSLCLDENLKAGEYRPLKDEELNLLTT